MACPRVLISDLDGTLVGDDDALARFAAWRAARGRDWRLVYATGRSVASVERLLGSTCLPPPDALVTDVGTVVSGPGREPWPGWPPPLGRWDAAVVREILDREPGLVRQPDVAQSDVKASYHAPGTSAVDILRIGRALRRRGLSGRLVHSGSRFLDVLPRATGKRAAARHVLASWGVGPRDAVTAGDSGNDRDLVRLGGYGIVVGNASPELATVRGPRIVHVGATHADGVLEGLGVLERLGVIDEPTERSVVHDAAPTARSVTGDAS